MNSGFLIQFAASVAAVSALVLLAAWARIPRPTPDLDDAAARALFAEEFPGRPIDRVWIASDGAGALARSADQALIVCRVGDGYAARSLSWDKALNARLKDGRLNLNLGEFGAPRAALRLDAWPPEEIAA